VRGSAPAAVQNEEGTRRLTLRICVSASRQSAAGYSLREETGRRLADAVFLREIFGALVFLTATSGTIIFALL
jgi:hypothetical protein